MYQLCPRLSFAHGRTATEAGRELWERGLYHFNAILSVFQSFYHSAAFVINYIASLHSSDIFSFKEFQVFFVCL